MSGTVKFEVGYDIEKFKAYYEVTLASPSYLKAVGENDGVVEVQYITEKPSRLVVWTEDGRIIGHAIWHESNIDEHKPGSPRDEDDRSLLQQLMGARKNFVELHELWLDPRYRGKGYGKKFFDFFENFARKLGHRFIVFYAFNEAAITLCRQRGHVEAHGGKSAGRICSVFLLSA